jgi:hypothetical protein
MVERERHWTSKFAFESETHRQSCRIPRIIQLAGKKKKSKQYLMCKHPLSHYMHAKCAFVLLNAFVLWVNLLFFCFIFSSRSSSPCKVMVVRILIYRSLSDPSRRLNEAIFERAALTIWYHVQYAYSRSKRTINWVSAHVIIGSQNICTVQIIYHNCVRSTCLLSLSFSVTLNQTRSTFSLFLEFVQNSIRYRVVVAYSRTTYVNYYNDGETRTH